MRIIRQAQIARPLRRAHEIFRDVMSEKASQAGEGMSSHNDGAALSFRRGLQDVRGDFLRIERFLELHQIHEAVDFHVPVREPVAATAAHTTSPFSIVSFSRRS